MTSFRNEGNVSNQAGTQNIAGSVYNNTIIYESIGDNSQVRLGDAYYITCENAGIQQNTISTARTLCIPFRENPDFVGRDEVLEEIQTRLRSQRKLAIIGVGGVGKTEIASAYCYQRSRESAELSIFWVHGDTIAAFVSSYHAIADRMGLNAPGKSNPEVLNLVKNRLEVGEVSSWLMVVDNADDYDVFRSEPPSVNDAQPITGSKLQKPLIHYIPSSTNGHVLFTSRSRSAGFQLAGNVLPIPALTSSESRMLLISKLGVDIKQDQINALSANMEHLPLAMVQACGFITSGMPVSEYISQLKGKEQQIEVLRKSLDDVRRREFRPSEEHPNDSIIQNWLLSLEQIQSTRGPGAIDIICFLSHFQRHLLPIKLVKHAFGTSWTVMRDLSTLVDFELVKIRPNEEVLDMHRFTQLTVWAWLEDRDKMMHSLKTSLLHFTNFFRTCRQERDFATCRLLVPHADELRKHEFDSSDQTQLALLNLWLGLYLKERGNHALACESLSFALNVLQHADQAHHEAMLLLLYEQADLLSQMGFHLEAEQTVQRATVAAERQLDREQQDPAAMAFSRSCVKLLRAKVLLRSGKWAEAEQLCRESLTIRQTYFPADQKSIMIVQQILAATLQVQCKYEEALEIDRKLLPTYIEIYGPDHAEVQTLYNNIGMSLIKTQKYKEAEMFLEKVMNSCRDMPEDHPLTLERMHSLTSCRFYSGSITSEEALHRIEKELADAQRLMTAAHPISISIHQSYATLLNENDRHQEALDISKALSEKCCSLLGEDHPNTLVSMYSIAVSLKHLGQHEQASRQFGHVYERMQMILGPFHELTFYAGCYLAQETAKFDLDRAVNILQDLEQRYQGMVQAGSPRTLQFVFAIVQVYQSLEMYAEAVIAMEKQYCRWKQDLTPRTSIAMLRILAESCDAAGDYPSADNYFTDLVKEYQHTIGFENSNAFHYIHAHAMVKNKAGLASEAAEMMRTLINARISVLGQNDHRVLTFMFDLANVLRNNREYRAAELLHRDVLARRRWSLPADDPVIADSLNHLALVLCQREDFGSATASIKECLQYSVETLGPRSDFALLAKHNLAYILKCAGQLDLARAVCTEVLTEREEIFGSHDARTLTTLDLKLKILLGLEAFAKIVMERTEALMKHETVHGLHHDCCLQVFHCTSRAFLQLQRFDEAETDALRVFDGALRLQGGVTNRHWARYYAWKKSYFTLITIYRDHSRFEELLRLGQRAVEVDSKIPENPPGTVIGMRISIAFAYQKLGEFERAIEEFEAVLGSCDISHRADETGYKYYMAIFTNALCEWGVLPPSSRIILLHWRSKLFAIGHETALQSLIKIARCFMHQYDPAAESTYEMVSTLAGQLHGVDASEPWQYLTELAYVHYNFGRYETAASLYEEAVEQLTRVLGSNHLIVVQAQSDLAMSRLQLGEVEFAESMMIAVVTQRCRLEGEHSAGHLIALSNLGVILRSLQRTKESIATLRFVLETRRVHNADTEAIARAQFHLATSLLEDSQLSEAMSLASQALEARNSIQRLHAKHPDILDARSLIVIIRLKESSPSLSSCTEELYDIIAKRTIIQGVHHPLTLRDRQYLALAYAMAGKVQEALVETEEVNKGFKVTRAEHYLLAQRTRKIQAQVYQIISDKSFTISAR